MYRKELNSKRKEQRRISGRKKAYHVLKRCNVSMSMMSSTKKKNKKKEGGDKKRGLQKTVAALTLLLHICCEGEGWRV